MKKLEGSVRISRISHSHGPDRIHITFQDVLAGAYIAVAELTMEQLGDVLTGREVECPIEVDDTGRVGKVRKTKSEFVPSRPWMTGEDIAEALAPFEVDGWKGHGSDMLNIHCEVRRDHEVFARVLFERWVEPEVEVAE